MNYVNFINQTYQDLFGRTPGKSELDYWSTQMRNGMSADQMLAHAKASNEYKNKTSQSQVSTNPPNVTGTGTPPAGGGTGGSTGISPNPAQVVPGTANPNDPSQVNVVDYAGQIVGNPGLHFGNDMNLGNNTPTIDPNAPGTTTTNPASTNYSGTNASTDTATAETASQVDPRQAVGYTPETTWDDVNQNINMEGAQGQVSEGAIIDENEVPQIDIEATANGQNALGQALLEHASQDLNTVDPKATVKGQLDQLQADFTGPNGEPIVPPWAQGAARAVSKIAAFKGMTGSAATAAMSQALMEASLPIATADAQFFQTLTLQNLSNKQQSIINRANILSRFEEINQDARTAAAIQNAKHFMEMDLANLENRQQAEIINTQARIQSIFEDAKAENTARMFLAQSTNDMNMFYDQLNSQVEMYNTSQINGMRQFNTSQINSMAQFNAQLENQREQFYANMQFQVDTANAQWRQTVTLQNNQNKFEAAAVDVRNRVDLSREQLNQIWDRSDALLDYIWKSSENELERENRILLATMQAQSQMEMAKMSQKAKSKEGIGSILGTVAGSFAENLFKSWF